MSSDCQEIGTSFPRIAGVDYGSRLAGTTVFAVPGKDGIDLFQSSKKADADRFVKELAHQFDVELVFIDAPLSLPGIYRDLPGSDDYFYRRADRSLQAMSPMFLGGLTARAMRLRAELQNEGIGTVEVYPAGLARELQLGAMGYKKDLLAIMPIFQQICRLMPQSAGTVSTPTNWHQIDALLALLTGFRHRLGKHQQFGSKEEGEIII